ncbi:ABC transporter permease subunit [Bacillus sp. JJ1609]|uniref:ABC transporter permease n=1 Tax=Bacillus sp. JJ1609 TaxID=3122977 RepID=UPI002FFED05D
MNQWFTLINKELLEMARNYKWIWISVSFILLGVIDPLTTFYMPQILDSVGGLPEGAVIEIPKPSANEVFTMSLGEYQTFGILIIALSTMGMVAGERKSGVAQLILVKPVSHISYISSKWASALLIMLLSLFLGLLASWYYTGVLYDFIPFGDFMSAFSLYGLWIAFVVTIVIFFSSIFIQPGAAGAVSLAIIIIINLIGSTFSHLMQWSPTQLLQYASEVLVLDAWPDEIWLATGITFLLIILLLASAVTVFKSKELAG